eukprot:5276099-Amphidinium_carterae.1
MFCICARCALSEQPLPSDPKMHFLSRTRVANQTQQCHPSLVRTGALVSYHLELDSCLTCLLPVAQCYSSPQVTSEHGAALAPSLVCHFSHSCAKSVEEQSIMAMCIWRSLSGLTILSGGDGTPHNAMCGQNIVNRMHGMVQAKLHDGPCNNVSFMCRTAISEDMTFKVAPD